LSEIKGLTPSVILILKSQIARRRARRTRRRGGGAAMTAANRSEDFLKFQTLASCFRPLCNLRRYFGERGCKAGNRVKNALARQGEVKNFQVGG